MITNSENNSDEWLVKQYQHGEREALSELIKRFHPKLVRTIRYQTRGNGPVEDIAQECWYSIIGKLPDLDLKISFNAWATTIARNRTIDWIRMHSRLQRKNEKLAINAGHEMATEGVPGESENLERIHFGIRQLPAPQQIILKMFYVENLSLKEISQVLDVSKGTVKSRLFYAREKLKEIITQQTENKS